MLLAELPGNFLSCINRGIVNDSQLAIIPPEPRKIINSSLDAAFKAFFLIVNGKYYVQVIHAVSHVLPAWTRNP